jgi:hypothetical protein
MCPEEPVRTSRDPGVIIETPYRIETRVCSEHGATPLCRLLEQGCSTVAIELTAPLRKTHENSHRPS